jgi:hypothetical protein
MTEVKLCKDCKWSKAPVVGGYEYAQCHAPQNVTIRLTDGAKKIGACGVKYCEAARILDSDCGKDAKWYEPKPAKPWWKFW